VRALRVGASGFAAGVSIGRALIEEQTSLLAAVLASMNSLLGSPYAEVRGPRGPHTVAWACLGAGVLAPHLKGVAGFTLPCPCLSRLSPPLDVRPRSCCGARPWARS
jgi:hypothetical protein